MVCRLRFISHGLEAENPKIRVLAGLVSGENLLSGSWMEGARELSGISPCFFFFFNYRVLIEG